MQLHRLQQIVDKIKYSTQVCLVCVQVNQKQVTVVFGHYLDMKLVLISNLKLINLPHIELEVEIWFSAYQKDVICFKSSLS